MVKICSSVYPNENYELYKKYFDEFNFQLSPFQLWTIQAIVEGNHVLNCAHTGSGKTLGAEFAINYFVKKGKKVIYTSPIKALSNQKFYEFKNKFPNISFGILTGDIKFNPDASVLIMTTEILMNMFYLMNKSEKNGIIDFNDVEGIVFDEIHYINDAERGKIWEETIMMMPKHIQMIMLSATLDRPEKFASWCENINNNKTVYLTTTNERIVPLTHYSFITCNTGIYKIIKDKTLEEEIKKNVNTLQVIQNSNGVFNEINYLNTNKILNILESKNQFVKRQHVLNNVSKFMVDNNMLPAICFILNRKLLETTASEITTNLLEDDSKVPYIIKHECDDIIRKLPNHNEFYNLPEYINLVSLLEKGIAIHHAGLMPVLKEMVELLFSKGYIKLLFATETFSVGINMPTKTVLMTEITKFDGNNIRYFHSHEYTQMAGRAGRRGIDTLGHVIHLPNLYKNMDMLSMKKILNGKPQNLISKFKISYNLLLNLYSNVNKEDIINYIKKSMIQIDINNQLQEYHNEKNKLENEKNNIEQILNCYTIPIEISNQYINLKEMLKTSVNKKKKEIEKNINNLLNTYDKLDKNIEHVIKYNNKLTEINKLNKTIDETENLLNSNVCNITNLLEEYQLIKDNKLTIKGNIALQIREIHCIIFSDIIINNELLQFETKELVGIFSCFTNIHVQEENKCIFSNSENTKINNYITELKNEYNKYNDKELENNIDTGIDYTIHYDLIDYVIKWCDCDDEIKCKILLDEIKTEKNIFLGDFVKAILKINNISNEMEKIAEYLGNMELLALLKKIPELTLKFVATNQSLYI
jgi:superfamily II RNA helicase